MAAEVRNRKLKEQAVAFYKQHDVTGALERLLNTMFLDSPTDVYGYMSDHFHQLSQEPTVARLEVFDQFDSEGEKALTVSVHCTIHGKENLVNQFCWPVVQSASSSTVQSPIKGSTSHEKTSKSTLHKDKTLSKTAFASSKEQEEMEEQLPSFATPHDSVTSYIAPVVKGFSLRDQQQIDEAVTQVQMNSPLHPSATVAVSFAVAQAASRVLQKPLWLHLADSFKITSSGKNISRFSVPLPISTIIAGGQLGCGKLKLRGFCLSSLPSCNLQEQVKNITATYREVGRLLAAKPGGVVGSSRLPVSGAYCLASERAEQVLDLVKEAAENLSLQLNRDLSVFIDVGAERIFDEDKQKYEVVSGQWKTSDELLGLYSSWLTNYPGLLGLIDPVHPKDKAGWEKARETLGDKCLLIAEHTLEDQLSMSPKSQESPSQQQEESRSGSGNDVSPALKLPLLSCGTLAPRDKLLSGLFAEAGRLRDHLNYLILQASGSQTADSLGVLADLGVALQCKFISVGAPVGLTSTVLFSRLAQIRAELVARSAHKPSSALIFSSSPCYKDTNIK